MKHLFYILTIITLSHTVFSQKVGINNTDPNVSLDINGALAHREVIIDPFMNNVNIPADASFVFISNVEVTEPVSIFAEYIDGKRLVIHNNSGLTATFNYSETIKNGETKEYICSDPGGYRRLTHPSQLEKITEGANTGWRLLGQDPANYGNIGNGAVDLSYSGLPSSTRGATGTYSTAMGYETTASGYRGATALGQNTTASGDDGATAMGSYTTASGTFGATAMGVNTTASGDYGATALGYYTTVSGDRGATALGSVTTASGDYGATALGYATTVSGDYGATALGYATTARSFASLATGSFNDTIAGSSQTTWVATDPLLTVGNGSSDASRSNAMTIYKNGNTDLNGFVRLGKVTDDAPRIKMKELTMMTSSSNDGYGTGVAHGLDASKIISVSVILQVGGLLIPPAYDDNSQFKYNYYLDGFIFNIKNQASGCAIGEHICSKTARIVITYKE